MPGQDLALTRNPKRQMAEPFATCMRTGLASLIAASIVGVAALSGVTSSSAQTVPMPKPAPKARSSVQMSASDPQKAPMTTGATSATPPEPVIPDPRRNVPASIFSSFDANQKAQAAKVSAYLSSLQTLAGNFVQVGPDGSRTKGDFYIQKPGKGRFEYDDPSPIELIADGSSVAVRDRKLATQDIYPLSQTPLRFLLAEKINLLRDANVVGIYQDELFVSVAIEEKHPLTGTHRLLIMFGARDFQLKQWTVTDQQGYDTTVAVYNLDASQKPAPRLFRLNS